MSFVFGGFACLFLKKIHAVKQQFNSCSATETNGDIHFAAVQRSSAPQADLSAADLVRVSTQ